MHYISKAEREAASRMTWAEIIAHVRKSAPADEPQARQEIANAIADGMLHVRWTDERKPPRGFSPLQFPGD